MIPCPSCHCHIQRDERTCPHCGTKQQHTGAGGPVGVGVIAWLVTALGAGCSPSTESEGEDGKTVTTASPTETSDSGIVTSDPTTTEDSSTETGSTETGTDTMNFVPNIDLAALYGECDVFVQDCADGAKCVAYASGGDDLDANKCVEILGDVPAGSPCTSEGPVVATDDCDADSACWPLEQDNDGWVGVCTPFCGGTIDSPMCADPTTCLIAYDGSLALCVDACDPFLQDCAPGLACHFNESSDSFSCWPGADAEGQACTDPIDSCAPGLYCLAAEMLPMCADAACCTAYCDLMNPGCAMPGTTCTALFGPGEAPLGAENLGVCSS